MNAICIIIFAAILAVLPAQAAFSQAILPPSVDLKNQKKEPPELTRDNLEKAKDLQDVIQQVEKLAYDYQTYLGDCDGSVECEKTRDALYKMLVNFDVGSYYLAPTNLKEDIGDLATMLREHEIALQKAHKDAKLYHLTKSLRQQLGLYEDILNQDVCPELRTDTASAEKIQAYLISQMSYNSSQREFFKEVSAKNKALIEKLKSEIDAQKIAIEASRQLKDQHVYILRALDLLRDSLSNISFFTAPAAGAESATVFTVPEVPEVPGKTVAPKPPKAPRVVIVGRDRTYSSGSGQAGATKELEDTMQVFSQKLPIYVNNKTGSLMI
ncbi:MAG TPA: hypothetical protein VJ983_06365, partial [candidate division Zixibacteria bacterium]|nr:hypothetical protein [candidate division Zixibacteria bacterium]